MSLSLITDASSLDEIIVPLQNSLVGRWVIVINASEITLHNCILFVFPKSKTPQHFGLDCHLAADLAHEWPPIRRQDQVFIFHNQEPPTQFWMDRSSPSWISAFNWTMTYRHDSDIVTPYGLVRHKRANELTATKTSQGDDYKYVLERKTRLVAAMLSHCGAASRRDNYIRELSLYVQIDVYGDCGNLTCPRNEDSSCFEKITSSYKFFLSFENAICEDYVTEKFFRFFNGDLITIVRGSNQYFIHAPREVFLNTADFVSPRQLAERIKYLDIHPEEYIQMLRAKDQYSAIFEDYQIKEPSGTTTFHHYHFEAVPVCQICHRLWNLDRYAKTIPNIKTWFKLKMCKRKTAIRDIGL
ncbi:alpha-(1,3)-fucosyltransferase c-like protein [Plakobranchus ocellatus]|uniref:Fucosyltransferase n=1 Tax=Plakobranchus ocellatus TaxID=259542 RepID=A0AAV4AFI4_9GAST|nr:alpha-(1,3)-fucosyltransferase c-like protein [Plakobranchus ocellatus]